MKVGRFTAYFPYRFFRRLCSGIAALAMTACSAAGPAGSGATGLGASGTGTVRPGSPAGPGSTPNPGTQGSNAVTIDGLARSVETTAPLSGLTSVHLTGASVLTAVGNVVDGTGHDYGSGTLKAQGSDLVVAGPAMELTGRLRYQPTQVTVTAGVGGSLTLGLGGPATVSAASVTFQAAPPQAPATATPATTAPPPPVVTVRGPVTLRSASAGVSGNALHLVAPPTDINVASPEADLSWAGSGAITTGSGPPIQAGYLGVRAQQLQVSLHRASAAVELHGTALALQAFANGVPQLRAQARIDVLNAHATTGFLGRRWAFVWTPRNLDSTYDMAILSVRPGNAAAGNVHLGLAPMPPMFGGEAHGLAGGDTKGLKGGDAIDSLIARNGDDKRTIGYDGPAGVTLVLVVQGNFDPITVTLTTS